MDRPFTKSAPKMVLAERDQGIQRLSTNGSDEPLAEGIGLRRQLRLMRTL
jgi:hypothetical protein